MFATIRSHIYNFLHTNVISGIKLGEILAIFEIVSWYFIWLDPRFLLSDFLEVPPRFLCNTTLLSVRVFAILIVSFFLASLAPREIKHSCKIFTLLIFWTLAIEFYEQKKYALAVFWLMVFLFALYFLIFI